MPTTITGLAYELVTVWQGHLWYEELIGPLRRDERLLAQMLQDAESDLEEEPGKRWCIAVTTRKDGTRDAGAWAAAVERDGALLCCNSYERPGWRGEGGLYAAVYHYRHKTIVEPSPLPALTYVFEQPLQLHLADGWWVTNQGDSDKPGIPSHHWYELRRP